MLALLFSNAEYRKAVSPGTSIPELNYTPAALSVVLVAGLGGLMLWAGNRWNRADMTRPRD
jgi:hypothetical protein